MISTNADAAARNLKRIFDAFEERVQEELDQAAKDTERYAKQEVPVESGQLRDSIEQRGRVVRVTAPYATAVHEGTRTRPANPFMDRAVERAIQDLMQRLKE